MIEHIMRREENQITKRVMSMNVEGHHRRGQTEKQLLNGLCEKLYKNKINGHGYDE
jgi:hypothetical protein